LSLAAARRRMAHHFTYFDAFLRSPPNQPAEFCFHRFAIIHEPTEPTDGPADLPGTRML